jgi:hypothetical protein
MHKLQIRHTSKNKAPYGYQHYYFEGIRQYLSRSRLGSCKFSRTNFLSALALNRKTKAWLDKNIATIDEHVGVYFLKKEKKSAVFAIDPHDDKILRQPKVQPDVDIYFKSNFWDGEQYPANVKKIINGSPLVAQHELYLKSLRGVSKDIDIVHITRPWGSYEHNIRIFEHLSRAKGEKALHCIFHGQAPDLLAHFMSYYKDRLTKSNVIMSETVMPHDKLWQLCSRAKIVILRSGVALCIPWRMLDLLAMGACIVVDHSPFPQWPVPLRKNVNFFSLGLERSGHYEINTFGSREYLCAEGDNYEMIPSIINSILDNKAAMQEIRHNNMGYFDTHAAPVKVGEYIVQSLLQEH